MKGKWIAFGAWTALVVAVFVFAGISLTKDKVYTGTKLEFNTGRVLQIDAESVTLEAASSDFFVLRKDSGETIVGVPTQRPLGWSYDKYFVFGPQEVPGGKWLFPDGNATFKITSEKPVTVKVVELSPGGIWVILCIIAILICLIGLSFVLL